MCCDVIHYAHIGSAYTSGLMRDECQSHYFLSGQLVPPNVQQPLTPLLPPSEWRRLSVVNCDCWLCALYKLLLWSPYV